MRPRTFPILVFLLMLFDGCAGFPHSGVHALVGSWTNRVGTLLKIRPGGTFDAFARDPRGGKVHVWGNYTIVGDTVTFRGSGGDAPNDCHGSGMYHFQRASVDILQFTLVRDNCRSRAQNLSLTWHRQ